MMAALVGGLDAKNLAIDLVSTMHAYFAIRFRNLPHSSDHSSGTPPGRHRDVGPSGTGRLVSAKASSIVLTHC